MEIIRITLSITMALLVSMPMCCCGVTFADSTNYEKSSCCSAGGSSGEQSPCEDGECSCLEASDQITSSIEFKTPSVPEAKLIVTQGLSDSLQIPAVSEQFAFYGVHRPPPPQPSFTKLYSVFQL